VSEEEFHQLSARYPELIQLALEVVSPGFRELHVQGNEMHGMH
jgi:hypothetical protein